MIHYYYGDGKGKTTAAMGLAIRALGRGKCVFIIQFLKDTPSGETLFFETLEGVTLCRGKAGKGFSFTMTEEEKQETKRIHNENLARGMQAVRDGRCDLLVLDEVGDACMLGLIDSVALLSFLHGEAQMAEIIMTGHTPVAELTACADYITQMKKEKHPYDSGVVARVGIEC